MLEKSNDRVEMRVEHYATGALIYDAARCSAVQAAAWFGLHASAGRVDGGRGGVRYVPGENGRTVIRHYHRGGLVARLMGDRFLYSGEQRTRPMREFHVLASAHALGLPVPRPVAAQFRRDGLFYRADLATSAIEPARTLASLVAHREVADFDWPALGRTIRRFHDAGVWHADLNAHNVLRDDAGTFWLLDFDRGWLAPARERWRRANLARLERSLRKVGLSAAVEEIERDALAPLRSGYDGAAR